MSSRRCSASAAPEALAGSDRITEPTFQFTPKDTVYVSVATEGTGGYTLSAAWRSQSGEILQQTSTPVGGAERSVSMRVGEEVQEVSRRGAVTDRAPPVNLATCGRPLTA
jgi:hypothetical protein